MKLELSLVKVPSISSGKGTLIERKRVEVKDASTALEATLSFIKDNLDVFQSSINNKSLIEIIRNTKTLTLQSFLELRYQLAISGLDVWSYLVADVEINPEEIPHGQLEYLVIDHLSSMENFFFATKITQPEDRIELSKVYTKISDTFGLMAGPIASRNYVKELIKTITEDEMLLGSAPVTRTSYLNSILEFLGKQLKVITN